jgi:hypothetical protein
MVANASNCVHRRRLINLADRAMIIHALIIDAAWNTAVAQLSRP